MVLLVDTSDSSTLTICLLGKRGEIVANRAVQCHFTQSEKLLPSIATLLKSQHQSLNKLMGLVVVSGPGGFTSLRIGISTANALAYALKIPIVGIQKRKGMDVEQIAQEGIKGLIKTKKQTVIVPRYGREPNITKPKKKKLRI